MKDEKPIKISLFEGIKDNNPRVITTTWNEFAQDFLMPHQALENKASRKLFAPAIFQTKRSNSDVIEFYALAADFDDGASPSMLTPLWKQMGLEYVIYQTFGCTPEHPKWRAVFPFDEPVSSKDYEAKKDIVRDILCQGYDDKATRDHARIYYLPTVNKEYYKKPEYTEWNEGIALDINNKIFQVEEKPKSKREFVKPSFTNNTVSWWDEFNENGYNYACQLLEDAGWTCLDNPEELTQGVTHRWAKPGDTHEHHATIRYYDESKLFMFYCFSPKAKPFEENSTYNWTTLANLLLFPEEQRNGIKSSLWRHLSRHHAISPLNKPATYIVEDFDNEDDIDIKPELELFPVSDIAENTIKAIEKINSKKADIDKLYLSESGIFCKPKIEGTVTLDELNSSELCLWLETRAEIMKEGVIIDGIPQSHKQRIGAVAKSTDGVHLKNIDVLRGFSTFPTITVKNAVSSKPHYDKQSKHIVCISEQSQEVIRNSFKSPSYEKAKRASEKIRGIFVDSPFMEENDWYKTLALIITPFLCDIYQDSIPMGVIKASQPETGKTELAKGIAAFTGKVNAKDYKKGMDTERLLASYILDDSRSYVLDNINGYFEDDFISVLSTSREVSIRELYKEATTVPNNLMILVAANNPRLSPDAISRSIEINIHVNQANPGSRKTKYSVFPKNYILNNYQKCLGWVMDILSYGLSCNAVSKADYQVVTRHSNWEKLVQQILNPIDIYPNFARSQELEDEDGLAVFIKNWWKKYKDDKVSISQLTRLAFYDGENEGLLSFLSEYQMVHTKNEENEKLLYKSLGNIIGKYKNKCFKFHDNLEVKLTKGRTASTVFYKLECLTLPEKTEEKTTKQMTFDEVIALKPPVKLEDPFDENDELIDFDWYELGNTKEIK